MRAGAKFLLLLMAFSGVASVSFASTTVYVPAVTGDGDGLMAKLTVSLTTATSPGNGEIYTSVSTRTGVDTQNSEKIANRYSEAFTGRDLDDYDIFFRIDTNAYQIDGPSAGAAMTIALIAEVQNRAVPENVTITGTINDSGVIGPVRGIYQKAVASSNSGMKLFVIPQGEAVQRATVTERVNGQDTEVTKDVNLLEYAPENLDLVVAEAATVKEALQIIEAGPDLNKIKAIERTPLPEFSAAPLVLPERFATFKEFSQELVESASAKVVKSEKLAENAEYYNQDLLETAKSLNNRAKTLLDQANEFLGKNYLYTGANFAFLALTSASQAEAILEHQSIITDNSSQFEEVLQQQSDRCSDLLKRLGARGVGREDADWVIGAQQRTLWACNNVNELKSAPAEVVVIGGQKIDITLPLDRLEKLMMASAWMDSAESMLSKAAKTSVSKKVSEESVAGLARKQSITIEDLLVARDCTPQDYESPLCEINAKELFTRYYKCSIDAKAKNWNAASIYCASVAKSALESDNLQNQIKNIDADVLGVAEAVESQLEEIREEIEGSPTTFAFVFWQHSKYLGSAARFHLQNGDAAQASGELSSSVLILHMSKNLANDSLQMFSASGIAPLAPGQEGKGLNTKLEVIEREPELSVIAGVLLGVLIVILAAIIIVVLRQGGLEPGHYGRGRERKRLERSEARKEPEYNKEHLERVKQLHSRPASAMTNQASESRTKTIKAALKKAEEDYHFGRINTIRFEKLKAKYETMMRDFK